MRRLFVSWALLLGVLVSCAPEENPADLSQQPSGPIEVEYIATFEELPVKTTLSGTKVMWEEGDKIALLYNGGSESLTVGHDGAVAKFSQVTIPSENICYGVYPESLGAEIHVDENSGESILLTVPEVQDGSFASANIALAKAENDTLRFKNLCGIIKFNITADDVRKVSVKGLGNDVLTGTVKASFSEDGIPVMALEEGVDCVTVNVTGEGEYYAAVLPFTTLQGYVVTVFDESDELINEITVSGALSLTRSTVSNIGEVGTEAIHIEWFVTPEGTKDEGGIDVGDGKTWETAISYKQMAMMISESGSDNDGSGTTAEDQNTERAAAVHDRVFYLAGGEYDTGYYVRMDYPERGTAVKLTVMGGFNPNSSGTDLSDRTSVTKFTNLNESPHRHFYIEGYVDMTFDGVTFSEGVGSTGTNGGGAVLYRNNTGSKLLFRNCVFANNESGAVGGAIQQAGGELIIDGCRFEGNSAPTDGGVIYAQEEADIKIKNSTFCNNSTKQRAGFLYAHASSVTIEGSVIDACSSTNTNDSQYGGAMYLGGAGVYKISSSTISNCVAGKYGGAIYLTSAGSILEIDNTVFDTNWAQNNRGGAISNNGECQCYLNQCSFVGNKAKTYAGALHAGSTATYYLNNCSFVNNYTTSAPSGGAGSAYWMKGGNVYMNNCSFYNNYKSDATAAGSDIRFGDAASDIIIVNTTIINDYSKDNNVGCINNAMTASRTVGFIMANNMILSNYLSINGMLHVSSKGYNYVSGGFTASENDTVLASTDFTKISQVGANPWYKHSEAPAGATVAKVKDALAGTKFLTWLTGLTVKAGNGTAIGALDYDIAGNARGEAAYTPGCYQGN